MLESNNQINSSENEIVTNYQAEIEKISKKYKGFCINKFEAICLTDLDNLPDPDILANEIIENIESGLSSFREIMETIGGDKE